MKGIDPKQLEIGREIEKEHRSTYIKIKNYAIKNKKWPPEEFVYSWIAEDHLKENPQYYTYLKEMENN